MAIKKSNNRDCLDVYSFSYYFVIDMHGFVIHYNGERKAKNNSLENVLLQYYVQEKFYL